MGYTMNIEGGDGTIDQETLRTAQQMMAGQTAEEKFIQHNLEYEHKLKEHLY